MTWREADSKVREKGWILDGVVGSHYNYVHPTLPGKITIPRHTNRDLAKHIVASLKKKTGI
jgi:predicted RNA binding protein YcfA (HicA-like mRNA interferase family)